MDWRVCFVLLTAAVVRAQETCLSGDDNPYLLFGTKTAYTFATSSLPRTRIHEIPGCRAVAIWLLNRHGSHLPEANEMPDLQNLENVKRNIIENYNNGNFRNTNQRMCPADVNLLNSWSWNPRQNVSHAGILTSDGYFSAQQLAKSWRQKFPELFTNNHHDYLFKYTNSKRTEVSLRAFTEGLFGQQAENLDIPKRNDDQLLRPFENCPAWIRDIRENNATLEQVRIFESQNEYKEMLNNISQRLGYNYAVDASIVKNMYQMCRYNKAWDVVQMSPWCAVFTREDLERFEYAEDLETFYQYGYGSELNHRVGCGLLADVLRFFHLQVANGSFPQQPRTVVQFAEGEALLGALVALRARRDAAPPRGAGAHASLARARAWRVSLLDPYGANLALVLYRCGDRHQVLVLSNEKPVTLERCRVGLCDWPAFRAQYAAAADACARPALCAAARAAPALALALALLALYRVLV